MPYQYTFKDVHKIEPSFQCDLKHYRCEHVNPKTDKKCNRKQYIGFDRCWQHLETDFHLKIKPSTLQGAGKGLFAYNATSNNDIVFKGNDMKGDRIVAYNGEVISHMETTRRYGEKNTAPYAARVNDDLVEDAACCRSAGSLANHKSHSKANAKLYSFQGKVFLRAIKNIRNGDEIFIDYGRQYRLHEPNVVSNTRYTRG